MFRRFHRLEHRVKLLENSQQNQNQNTNQNQRTQQVIMSSYPPTTTPSYPQIQSYPPVNSYPTPYTGYQAPSAPPYVQSYTNQGPML